MDQVGTGHPSFEALSAYHDAESTLAERSTLDAHLLRCTACRKTLAGFDLLGMALQAAPAPSCADLVRLLSVELDGEARTDEAALVHAHLSTCGPCRTRRASWQALDLAIAALPAGAPSPAADATIRGLAHRPRRVIPTGPALGGGMLGRFAAAAIAILLAIIATLPPGTPIVPPAASGEDRPLVASAQQVLNARTNTLYILHATEAYVVAKDATTNVELAHINVGGKPTALALSSSANLVYVLDPSQKTLTTISGDTNTVTATKNVPLSGTITSIQVNQSTGQVVIGASANAAPSAAPGELAIIDPTSQKLETRSVDVAPTQVVLASGANRMFLLGANGTSVVDATTYATIATLPVAVAVAPSATGGADAILSNSNGRAELSFYGSPATASFDGTPVNAVSLPDGSFAILVDIGGAGRIELVDRLGGTIGSLDLAGSAKGLTFDPDARRFLGPNGQVVATITGTAIALVAPTPVPATIPSAKPTTPAATSTPAPSASSAPTTQTPRPSASAPPAAQKTAPVPGATLAATGLYRLPLAGGVVPVIVAGGGDRLWFVDEHGVLHFIDTTSGATNAVHLLRPDAAIARLSVTATTVYALDAASATLFAYGIDTGKLTSVSVPFGRAVTAMDVAPDGRVWLGASGFSGLLAFDPRAARFDLVPLAGSVSVGALTTDLAGQVWFIDGTNGRLDRYDPASARLTQLQLPANDTFVALRADTRGAVWIGSTSGSVFRMTGETLIRAGDAGAPVIAFALGTDGSIQVLAAAAQFTLAGPVGGAEVTAAAGVRSFGVDSAGRLWLADRTGPLFYIVERP